VDHALALRAQERDRLLDHREVLAGVDLRDLLEMQRPGLAEQSAYRREAVGQQPQCLVVLRAYAAPSRHPERGNVGVLEPLARELFEQRLLLGIGAGETG